jgi:hypothetical protein
MQRFVRHRRIIAVAALAVAAAGCGSEAPEVGVDQIQGQMLQSLGESYRMYSIARKQPPRKIADLSAIPSGGTELDEVRKGEIVVQWGAKLPDTNEEPGLAKSPEVLAYWKHVPEKGGQVLMLDRTVKEMTPDEFRAAPKAGGASQ